MTSDDHIWINTYKKDPTGVTVFTTSHGQINYPTATGFRLDPDGTTALHVISGEDIKAIHADGRWDSVVFHGPAPKPAEVKVTDSSGAVIARASFNNPGAVA